MPNTSGIDAKQYLKLLRKELIKEGLKGQALDFMSTHPWAVHSDILDRVVDNFKLK